MPDFTDMTGKEMDAFIESVGVDEPKGWSSMRVAEKREWLAANAQASQDETPDPVIAEAEAPVADAPTPIEEQPDLRPAIENVVTTYRDRIAWGDRRGDLGWIDAMIDDIAKAVKGD